MARQKFDDIDRSIIKFHYSLLLIWEGKRRSSAGLPLGLGRGGPSSKVNSLLISG